AAAVDQLLAAGVEGMAVRADLDVQLGLGRSGHELVAARAAHAGLDVLGMDARLHCRRVQAPVAPRPASRGWDAPLPGGPVQRPVAALPAPRPALRGAMRRPWQRLPRVSSARSA